MKKKKIPSPCDAGLHLCFKHFPPEDDGMGAWKCDACGYILSITEIQNSTCELICNKMLAKAAEKSPKGKFASSKMNLIVEIMRRGLGV